MRCFRLTLPVACLVLSVLAGCSWSTPQRAKAGRKDFGERLGETVFHLREPKSAEWSGYAHHLRRSGDAGVAWKLYVETGRTEGGLGMVAEDLFTRILGPWSFDGLSEYSQHLVY